MKTFRIESLLRGCPRAQQYRLRGVDPSDPSPIDPIGRARQEARNAVEKIALRAFFDSRPNIRAQSTGALAKKTLAPNIEISTAVDAIAKRADGREAITMARLQRPSEYKLTSQAGAEIAAPAIARLAAAQMAIAMSQPTPLLLVFVENQSFDIFEETIPARRSQYLAEETIESALERARALDGAETIARPYPKDSSICQRCEFRTACGNVSDPENREGAPESPSVSTEELKDAIGAYIIARKNASIHERKKGEASETIKAALAERANKTFALDATGEREIVASLQSSERIAVNQKKLRQLVQPELRKRFTTVKVVESLRITERKKS